MTNLVPVGELVAALEAETDSPEWVVLSGALAHPHIALELPLTAVAFQARDLGAIWAAIQAVASAGDELNGTAVRTHMRESGALQDIEAGTIPALRRNPPTEQETRSAAAEVRDSWRRSMFCADVHTLLTDGVSERGSFRALVDQLGAIHERYQLDNADAEEDIGRHCERFLQLAEHGVGRGPPSGYNDWDERSGGLTPGDLHVVAARTSVGKTAFALGPVWHRSVRLGEPAAYLTLEMAPHVIVARIVSQMSGVPLVDVMRGKVDRSDWPAVTGATAELAASPLRILAPSAPTLVEVLSAIGRMRNAGCELVAIDQLSQIQAPKSDRHDIGLKAITSALKAAALRHGVAVLLLHQINRGVEGRENKRPMASDLRDASIEDDCDTITTLFRREYYMRQLGQDPGIYAGKGEAVLVKVRNGEPGAVEMAFNGETARWGDLEDRWAA